MLPILRSRIGKREAPRSKIRRNPRFRASTVGDFFGTSDCLVGKAVCLDLKSPASILNLLPDCFLFQFLQLSSQLFGLIAKLVDALSHRGRVFLAAGCGRCLSSSNYWRSHFSRQVSQGLVERVSINKPVAHSQYYLLKLWHAGFGGLNVDGLKIKEASSHGECDDAAAQHARTLLVPQREVFGNGLVLVDARFNLRIRIPLTVWISPQSSQQKNGGSDGTRTRNLLRGRQAF